MTYGFNVIEMFLIRDNECGEMVPKVVPFHRMLLNSVKQAVRFPDIECVEVLIENVDSRMIQRVVQLVHASGILDVENLARPQLHIAFHDPRYLVFHIVPPKAVSDVRVGRDNCTEIQPLSGTTGEGK